MKHWASRGAIAWLLWPASLVFAVVVAVRRIFYKLKIFGSIHPGIPVIVVGNLSAGGSGKTPLVLRIAEVLREHGWKPGIVSRGYLGGTRAAGGSVEAPREATIASDPAEVGDEPMPAVSFSDRPSPVGAPSGPFGSCGPGRWSQP